MPHKFILGQTVEYYAPRGLHAPSGFYVVTAKLPEREVNLSITLNVPVNCTNAL
jgi:hypothetical protein